LRWQCRRGLLELDCIFEDYLQQRYVHAPQQEQQLFRELLNQQDPDLQAWILYGEQAPGHLLPIIKVLRAEP